MPMPSCHVLNALQKRYAVRIFDPNRKISSEDWTVLEQSLLLSPSGYGLQPWKFMVVENPALRKKLREVSIDQSQVEDSSHFVVFAAKTSITPEYIESYIDRIANVREIQKDSLKGYRSMMVDDLVTGPKSHYVREWAARQVYIALGTLVTAAAQLGIGTCPLEGIEPEKYDEVLSLSGSGYRTVVACSIGYGCPADKYMTLKKVRFEKDQVIHYL